MKLDGKSSCTAESAVFIKCIFEVFVLDSVFFIITFHDLFCSE